MKINKFGEDLKEEKSKPIKLTRKICYNRKAKAVNKLLIG